MKSLFLIIITIFFPLSLHAEWEWSNDLAVATASPHWYEARFTYENKGTSMITVTGLAFSCPCTVYRFQAISAKPGKTGTLTVRIARNSDDDLAKDLDLIVSGSPSTTSRELTIRIKKP